MDNKNAPVLARKEVIHKACLRNFTTYEDAECKRGKFILGVVEYTWVCDLNWDKTYYTLVTAIKLIDHLQEMCGGLHAVDVLTLQNEMQCYHIDS